MTEYQSVAEEQDCHSAIYEGSVGHRRFVPKGHSFHYRVFMVYMDLQKLDQIFSKSRWWSHKYFGLAWFRRKDFFDGKDDKPLYAVVQNKVKEKTGKVLQGPIKILTNLRYFGFIMNPITCYYCFDRTGDKLEAIVAEVTNTPWRQRCHYVIDVAADHCADDPIQHFFNKEMHVSPFQPMDLFYGWQSDLPGATLAIHLNVFKKNNDSIAQHSENIPIFDASLRLNRHPMTQKTMDSFLFRYPWMTLKVCGGIYWQALKLWFKKIPYYSHSAAFKKSNNTKAC